jgi:hypothetical protein
MPTRYAEPAPAYPLVSATAVMIHQLALDLYQCVGAVWAIVATRNLDELAPLCVYGQAPNLDATLRHSESLLSRDVFSSDRDTITELESPAASWTPHIVCPTFVRNEIAGALIFGPKGSPDGYRIEEKELVREFARHISKLLHKDPMAGCR